MTLEPFHRKVLRISTFVVVCALLLPLVVWLMYTVAYSVLWMFGMPEQMREIAAGCSATIVGMTFSGAAAVIMFYMVDQ